MGYVHTLTSFVVFYICDAIVSLSLKVGSHRGERCNSGIWKQQLITNCRVVLNLNIAQIDELKKGLSFAEAVELPQDLRPTADLMGNILVPSDSVSTMHFKHLK